MNEAWITSLSVLLIALGVASEVVLGRALLRECGQGRRARRPKDSGEHGTNRANGESPGACARPRLLAFLLGSALLGAGAHAQQSAPTAPPSSAAGESGGQPSSKSATPAEATPADSTKSPYSLQLNFDYTTAYFYHGIVQEDSGLILQPAAKLTINLYEKGDFKVDAYLATWNSFHGQETGAQTQGDFTSYWYECDLLGGIAVTYGKFSLASQYVFLTSPSDAYETVQELDFTLSFDDSAYLKEFALHPYALLAIETGADCSDGANSDPGTYLELGVAPGFSFDAWQTPVAVTFPASIGLSLHDYYEDSAGEDDTFGFAQVGAKASIPLPFGERWGKWTLTGGIAWLYLGDHTADYNGGHHDEIIGTVGLQLSF